MEALWELAESSLFDNLHTHDQLVSLAARMAAPRPGPQRGTPLPKLKHRSEGPWQPVEHSPRQWMQSHMPFATPAQIRRAPPPIPMASLAAPARPFSPQAMGYRSPQLPVLLPAVLVNGTGVAGQVLVGASLAGRAYPAPPRDQAPEELAY